MLGSGPMRSTALALFVLLVGCHQAPLHALYPRAGGALRRAVYDTVSRRACGQEGPMVVERGDSRYEVRGCGETLTYVCSDPDRGECQQVRTHTQALADPTAELETIARIAHEQEAEVPDAHAAVLISGAALLGIGVVGGLVGVLAYSLHECGISDCPPGTGSGLATIGAAAIATSVIGLGMLIGGAVSWRLSLDRRRDRGHALAEPCSSLSFEMSPSLAGAVGQVCF